MKGLWTVTEGDQCRFGPQPPRKRRRQYCCCETKPTLWLDVEWAVSELGKGGPIKLFAVLFCCCCRRRRGLRKRDGEEGI